MFIADLHIHSKYSRATSSQSTLEYLDLWAGRKGINLVGTGDFTHPAWREEMEEKLVPAEEGLYVLKEEYRLEDALCGRKEPTRFILSGEISCIYKKNEKVRKVHNVILLPSLEAAQALSKKLEEIGNIHSDGRPILGLDSRDLLEITLETCPEAIFIPAHIWTPHFSLFGAFSQFHTIEECYGDLTPYIHALETGLSSDPPMNYRLSALDRFQLVSNSDAHSPAKLGREANIFDTELSYPAVKKALEGRNADGFVGTIEFFPEEGKYHLDGHRNCALCLEPEETIAYNGICPVCSKKITVGVLHRVEDLADRPSGYLPADGKAFESLVPLPEVIAASMGVKSAASRKVEARYETLLRELGNEFYILREAPFSDIEQVASFPVAEGIRRMRQGKITLAPGFDGEYGKVKLFEERELEALSGQMSLFGAPSPGKEKKKAALPAAPEKAVKMNETPLSQKGKEELNSAQLAAVTAEEPVVAVIAGPGTGKTKTLISRILYLIKEKSVPPERITAVTFTNKAAGEMRRRLEKELGKRNVKKMRIGTFHSICLRLLGQDEQVPAIVDEFEAQAIAAELLKEREAAIPVKDFLRETARVKINALKEEEYDVPTFLVSAYQAKLEEYGAMDFDDVLIKGLEQAERTQDTCFEYLLVDEFQDINDLQYRLIKAWGENSKSLFLIGDPDQSIYGFRGSNAACFELLKQDYPEKKLRVITLEENYRSAPEILDCAVPVINHNPGAPRKLRANLPHSEAVRSLEAESDYSEAIYVAHEIDRLVGGVDMLLAHSGKAQTERNLGFSDIAVLYRTHRQSEALEHCLRQQGVPYVVTGRDKTLSKPVVRGILSFFRSVLNEHDKLSRQTAIRLLFGKKTADPAAQPAYEATAEHFRAIVETQPPKALIEQLLSEITPPNEDGIDKLLCTAVCYDSMRQLLANALLGKERDLERSGSDSYNASSVTLMTFHGAKGLEFPVVFLCGAREGLLPLETEKHAADVEEERRLFYVGMTRAKQELVMLHSGTPSRFLAEAPEDKMTFGPATHQKYPSGGKQLSLFD